MTAITHTCVTIACDVCHTVLTDDDNGGIPHFTSAAEAAKTAYADYWIISVSGYALCDNNDAAHRTALAALMPAFDPPPHDDQPELPFDGKTHGEATR